MLLGCPELHDAISMPRPTGGMEENPAKGMRVGGEQKEKENRGGRKYEGDGRRVARHQAD